MPVTVSKKFLDNKRTQRAELEAKANRLMDGIVEATVNSQLGDAIMFGEEYYKTLNEINMLDRQLLIYKSK
jgi:hypothetical protein